MDEECFQCESEALKQSTLLLESGKVVENAWMCEPCLSAFRDEPWAEVHEAPVLVRGGNGND